MKAAKLGNDAALFGAVYPFFKIDVLLLIAFYYISYSANNRISFVFTAFKQISAAKKVIGVKMSGERTFEMQQYKTAGGEGLLVFNGPDEPFLAGRIISHNDHDSQVQLNKEIEETAAYYFSK